MAYKSDNLKGTCFNSVKCTAKPVPELFRAGKRLTSQIFAKAANSKVLRHFQAQMSFPAHRPVPQGTEFRPWRCRAVANVFAKPQIAKFAGLAIFLRCSNHFCKSPVINNDINRYEYYEHFKTLAAGFSVKHRQKLENSRLLISGPDIKPVIIPYSPNMIPPMLVDFFSSVALADNQLEQASFVIPFFDKRNSYQLKFHIRPGGDPPDEIQMYDPAGHCVLVNWPDRISSQTGKQEIQKIYYDQQHQLIWQKSVSNGTEIRQAVSKEVLIATYPEAEQKLSILFQKNNAEVESI